MLLQGHREEPEESVIYQVEDFQLNLNPWKSRLQTVNPIGGRVACPHLNIHIQGVQPRTRVAFSPEGLRGPLL